MHIIFTGFQSVSNLFHRSCSFWIHCPSHVLRADLLIFQSKGRFDIHSQKKWQHSERISSIHSWLAILPHTSSSLHRKTAPPIPRCCRHAQKLLPSAMPCGQSQTSSVVRPSPISKTWGAWHAGYKWLPGWNKHLGWRWWRLQYVKRPQRHWYIWSYSKIFYNKWHSRAPHLSPIFVQLQGQPCQRFVATCGRAGTKRFWQIPGGPKRWCQVCVQSPAQFG